MSQDSGGMLTLSVLPVERAVDADRIRSSEHLGHSWRHRRQRAASRVRAERHRSAWPRPLPARPGGASLTMQRCRLTWMGDGDRRGVPGRPTAGRLDRGPGRIVTGSRDQRLW